MSACDFAYADRQAHALVDAQPPQVSGGFHVSRPSITGRCYAHISWKKKLPKPHTLARYAAQHDSDSDCTQQNIRRITTAARFPVYNTTSCASSIN